MSSHLSQEQLNEIKSTLDTRYKALQKEIHDHLINSGDAKYAEIAGQVHDMADESVADLLADLNYTVIDKNVEELKAIEKALYTIQTGGDYGVCIDCGVDIPFERLKVEPTAQRCVDCQSAYEAKFKRGVVA